jgi:hypothetical protein
MNIYLIVEDGEQFCIKADTPKEAIDICLKGYLQEEGIEVDESVHPDDLSESQWYYDEILQSCSLVGQLRN